MTVGIGSSFYSVSVRQNGKTALYLSIEMGLVDLAKVMVQKGASCDGIGEVRVK